MNLEKVDCCASLTQGSCVRWYYSILVTGGTLSTRTAFLAQMFQKLVQDILLHPAASQDEWVPSEDGSFLCNVHQWDHTNVAKRMRIELTQTSARMQHVLFLGAFCWRKKEEIRRCSA